MERAPAPEPTGPAAKHGRPKRLRRQSRQFIRGPLPLEWFGRAAELGRPALAVALALWWRAGVERRAQVALSMQSCKLFGVPSRRDRREALARLQSAGLIGVERSTSKSPVVTIVE